MQRRRLVNMVQIADGVGCAACAVAVLGNDRIASAVAPSLKVKWPITIALGVTSALLLLPVTRGRVTNADLERSALTNMVWVAACTVGIARRPSAVGTQLLAATAALDALAAMAQWTLRSKDDAPQRPGWTNRSSTRVNGSGQVGMEK